MPALQTTVLDSIKQDEAVIVKRFAKYQEYKAKSDAIKSFKNMI